MSQNTEVIEAGIKAIKKYGFEALDLARLISIIDIENIASQRVAAKTGLKEEKVTTFGNKQVQIWSVQKTTGN